VKYLGGARFIHKRLALVQTKINDFLENLLREEIISAKIYDY